MGGHGQLREGRQVHGGNGQADVYWQDGGQARKGGDGWHGDDDGRLFACADRLGKDLDRGYIPIQSQHEWRGSGQDVHGYV